MGTTRSFLLLKNRGFTREELKRSIPGHMEKEKAASQKMARGMAELLGADKKVLAILEMLGKFDSHTAIAFREDAKWLPCFIDELCDGNIVSSRELKETSAHFQTPVLAFAIFDSDILFVSYCDAEKQAFYDYAKPNHPWIEEYDTEVYQAALPAFLLSLDRADNIQQMEDIQRLKDIWDEEKEGLDADDRMYNLLQFLGMQVIYDEKDIPKGFVRIGG